MFPSEGYDLHFWPGRFRARPFSFSARTSHCRSQLRKRRGDWRDRAKAMRIAPSGRSHKADSVPVERLTRLGLMQRLKPAWPTGVLYYPWQPCRQRIDGQPHLQRQMRRLQPERIAVVEIVRMVPQQPHQPAGFDALAHQPVRKPGQAHAVDRRIGDGVEVVEPQPAHGRDLGERAVVAREQPWLQHMAEPPVDDRLMAGYVVQANW